VNRKIILALLVMAGFAWGCGDDDDTTESDAGKKKNSDAAAKTSDAGSKADSDPTADFEFDAVTFTIAGGDPQEVHINGLALEELKGADKISGTQWDITTRQGVRFSKILERAAITQDDDAPVNCVARDNFDPLRTKLANDTSKLPTYAFFRDFGYVYVGSPGDKDPLYPEMEGKSLIVDYNLASDDDVPAYLGGTISSMGMFRWKMIEKVSSDTRGMIELAPVIQ
jgi:hypothetical protein